LIFRVALLLVAAASCGGDGRTADNLPADSVGIAIRDPGLWPVMTFVPTGTEIDSLPLALIDSSWSLATPLDVSMLPQHDSTGVFGVSDSVGFRFEGDFNHDGIPDRARGGVYHDDQGDEGSFVLILTRSSPERWTRAFVDTEPGEPRLTVLVNDPSGLIWAECMSCGRWRPVFWSEGHYELGPPSESGTSP